MYTSTELNNIRNSGIRLWSAWAKEGYSQMTNTLNPDTYDRQVMFYLVNVALKFAIDTDQTDEAVQLVNLLVAMDSFADGTKLAFPII
jgi:hypothetical protein